MRQGRDGVFVDRAGFIGPRVEEGAERVAPGSIGCELTKRCSDGARTPPELSSELIEEPFVVVVEPDGGRAHDPECNTQVLQPEGGYPIRGAPHPLAAQAARAPDALSASF